MHLLDYPTAKSSGENIAASRCRFNYLRVVFPHKMSNSETAAPARVEFVTISDGFAGQRIDNFLITHLKGTPKTLIYRILRKGEVRVNKGRIKPEYRLQAGDLIRIPPLRLPPPDSPPTLAQGLLERLEAAIVYEDKQMLVVNKPAGIAVHGGSGLQFGIIEAFRQLRPQCSELELVHRLDRDTSGLLMLAKKRSQLRRLHAALRDGSIDKGYMALVAGSWPTSRKQVSAPLQKSNLRSGERMVEVHPDGKESLTRFRVLQRFGDFATLVQASPVTGRTHQIRVHCLHAGHPIAGDNKYGDDEFSRQIRERGGKRLFLHAHYLAIPRENEQPLELRAEPDDAWQATLEKLQ